MGKVYNPCIIWSLQPVKNPSLGGFGALGYDFNCKGLGFRVWFRAKVQLKTASSSSLLEYRFSVCESDESLRVLCLNCRK